MADKNEKDAAQSAIYNGITSAIEAGHTSPAALHHLAEAYALVTTPGRSSGGASSAS